ncbi:MAG: hypothetical protein EA412_04975 [Chitinophagaceae bacterium]|nr:MAG: hypothetical protein EA412_04975 [Chitinophagaceae bacterium]
MITRFTRFSLFLVLLFLGFVFTGNTTQPSDWTMYYEDGNIQIDYKKVDCDVPSSSFHNIYNYLRVENLTASSLSLTFHKLTWYNGSCSSCIPNDENKYTIELNPGEIKTGQCERNPESSLQIFHSMIKPENHSVLTKFELKNIKTTVTN